MIYFTLRELKVVIHTDLDFLRFVSEEAGFFET